MSFIKLVNLGGLDGAIPKRSKLKVSSSKPP